MTLAPTTGVGTLAPTTGALAPVGLTDPLFGTYPSEQQGGFVIPTLGSQPLSPYAQQQNASSLALAGAAGLSITPQEQSARDAATAENAIARISQVNPDLAKELLAKMSGQDHADSGGFWGAIKHVAGDILSVPVHIGAAALDILARPAHIIPALLDNKSGTPWYTTVAQALSGANKTTWTNVLEDKFGMKPGFLTGALGFIGDVGTDPLTYLTFGTVGIGREVAARAGADAVAKLAAERIGGHLAGTALGESLFKGATGEDVTRWMLDRYEELQHVSEFKPGGFGKLGDGAHWEIDADVAAALAGRGVQETMRESVASVLEAADKAHRLISTSGLRGAPQVLANVAGRDLTKQETFQALEQARRVALMAGRPGYKVAKGFAGAAEGVRFRFALPFTDLRYISSPLPFTEGLSPFGPMRRFFTGQSASTALLSLIDKGNAEWKDYFSWTDQGYKGLKLSNPDLHDVLRARGQSFGGMFDSLSEQFAGITGSLSPGAKAIRQGLTGAMAGNVRRLALGWRDDTLAYGWEHATLKLSRRQMEQGMAKAFHDGAGKIDRAAAEDAIRYKELVPNRDADRDLAAYFQQKLAALTPDTEEYATAEASFEDAKALRAKLTDDQRHWVYVEHELQSKMNSLADREGVPMGNTENDAEYVSMLHQDDVRLWNGNSRVDLRDRVWYAKVRNAGQARKMGRKGADAVDLAGSGEARRGFGVQATSPLDGEAVEGTNRVAVRLHKPAVIDERPLDARPNNVGLDDKAHIDGLYDQLTESVSKLVQQGAVRTDALRAAVDQVEALAGKVKFQDLSAEAQDTVHRLVTEALQKEGYDGVVHFAEDGVHATAFRPQDMKVVADTAPRLIGGGRGYVARTLTEWAESFLRGDRLPEEEAKNIIYGEPKLHHDVQRVSAELSFFEAEQRARDLIAERMHLTADARKELATRDIFERDPIRRHHLYVTRVTTALLHESLGWNAGRIAHMADLAPGLLAGPVGRTVWDAPKVADVPLETLQQLPKSVQRNLDLVVKRHGAFLKAQERVAHAAESALVRVRAVAQGEGRTHAAAAVRDVRVTTRKTASEATRELLRTGAERKQVLKDIEAVAPAADRHAQNLQSGTVLWRGSNHTPGQRLLAAGGGPWDQLRFLSESKESAATYGADVQRYVLKKGAKVLREDSPEFKAMLPVSHVPGADYLGAELNMVVTEARAAGYDAIRMTDQDALGTAVINRDMLNKVSEPAPPVGPITAAEARGNSREVSVAEYKRLAARGRAYLDALRSDRSPTVWEAEAKEAAKPTPGALSGKAKAPPSTWDRIVADTHEEVQKSWGGATIDAHTGQALPQGEDAYALRARTYADATTVTISEEAAEDPKQWEAAMDEARKRFKVYLQRKNHYLGVFHDDDLKRVDIDPVVVVKDPKLAEAIGIETRAVGGAYHFKTGDGLFPPHLAANPADKLAELDSRIADLRASLTRAVPPADTKLPADLSAPKTAATQTRLEKRAGKELDAVEHMANSLADEHSGLTAGEVRAARGLTTAETRLNDAIHQVNTAIADAQTEYSPAVEALVPMDKPRFGFVPVQVKDSDGKGMALPAYLAAEFNAITSGGRDIGVLHKHWREFLGVWKAWATYRFPGFHIRNMMGAFFNNMLGGVDAQDWRFAMDLQKGLNRHQAFVDKVIPDALFDRYALGKRFRQGKGKLTYGDLANVIHEHGIGTANAAAVGDLRTLPDAIAREVATAGYRGWFKKTRQAKDALEEFSPYMPFTRRFGRSATAHTENFVRTAGFLGGLKQTGGDFLGARAFTMMRHGDYNDLTTFERNFVKDVIPFYKWLRTNFPYQLRTLIENPGASLTVEKGHDLPYTLQGIDPAKARAQQPEWMRHNLNIPLKHGDATTYMMLDLPFNDLQKGARDLLTSALPLVMPMFESYIGKDLFTGGDITAGHMVPIAGWAQLPGIKQVLEATGVVKRDANGNELVDQRVQKVLSTVPIFARFRNWVYAEPSRAQLRLSTVFSNLTGTSLRPVDPSVQLGRNELAFYYEQVLPYITMYKDLGIELPTLKDMAATHSAFQSSLGA
jgi:hypothetical protein